MSRLLLHVASTAVALRATRVVFAECVWMGTRLVNV